jgi:hypothetical protein
MAQGGRKKNTPQIRLAIAFPLVAAGTGATLVAAGLVAEALPQTRQNLSFAETSAESSADKVFPQPSQNEAMASSRSLRLHS